MKKILALIVVVGAASAFAQGLLNNRIRNGINAPNPNAASTTTASSSSSAPSSDVGGRDIEFNNATMDMVFIVYENLVGKTILRDPQAPKDATITLQPKKGQELSNEDKILAIETVLEMNGVHLEPYGEKFIRAVARGNARKDGIPLIMDPEAGLDEHSMRVVSVMLSFQSIALDEAQKALEGLKSDKGVLNVYERTSSILVTDTEMNLVRMREIAKAIDIPTPVTENVFVRQIKNANANDIKAALDAIVQESQKELEKEGKKANQIPQNRGMMVPYPGRNLLNRNNQPQPQPTANESLVTSVSDADRGMIRGKVLILADERSNKLVVVTNKSNMDFFDKVIEQLDVETTPDTVVKVYRLKYADAEDVSDMINDLIGNAAASKNSKGSQNQNSKSGTNANMTRNTTTASGANQRTGEAKTGELSKDNTTVLADKRINGLVVMTNKELVPVLEQIIEAMDIKLSQVLIETCIIEVTLGDDLATGIDWVNNHWTGRDPLVKGGGGGGSGSATLRELSGGTSAKSFSDLAAEAKSVLGDNISMDQISSYIKAARDQEAAGGSVTPIATGVSYFLKSDKLNLSAIISASKSDQHAKYLASPVVMTVDNKEATINATEARKFFAGYETSSSYSTYVRTPKYDNKDIGIQIKVTPKINPNGTVMLEVEEEYSQLGAGQSILVDDGGTATIDTSLTRKMSADILLEDGQTVILGGLTETYTSEKTSGIPLLKDIPLIGKWLFGSVAQSESRKELLVFMTPYVFDNANDAQIEADRRKKALSDANAWEDHGWSKSALADPVSQKELLRRHTSEWKKQDEEHAAELAIENAKLDRAVELGRRTIAEKKQKAIDDAEREEKRQEIEAENADLLNELKEETK